MMPNDLINSRYFPFNPANSVPIAEYCFANSLKFMNALNIKIFFIIFTLFSFSISQEKLKSEYYYYGHCDYDTTFVKKDTISGKLTSGRCCSKKCIEETENRAELEVYGDDSYIRTKDCKAIIRKINSSTPVFAEYCLQEYYDYAEKRKIPDKWNLRLVKILDIITKIYPYEYEEIRECTWNPWMVCSIDVPSKYDSVKGIWTGGLGVALPCQSESGYILSLGTKNKRNKVKEYYSFFKEIFHISIPYADYWPEISRKDLESYRRFDKSLGEFFTINWTIYGGCPPKEDKNKHFFSGSYNIRIIGKCDSTFVIQEN